MNEIMIIHKYGKYCLFFLIVHLGQLKLNEGGVKNFKYTLRKD